MYPKANTAKYMSDSTAKKQVAVRLPIREKAELEREAVEREVSRSEYIRSILRDRHRADKLESRLEIREERIDELESQLGKRSEIEQQIEQLPARIKGEQTYQDRRQRVLDSASPLQRLKWQLTGVPVERIDAVGSDDED